MTYTKSVGCFMEYDGKFLILRRRPDKRQGNLWELPSGKVGKEEADKEAIVREIREETGYITDEESLEPLGEWVRNFPVYRLELKERIEIIPNPDEHQKYRWVTPRECYSGDLSNNLVDVLHIFLGQAR